MGIDEPGKLSQRADATGWQVNGGDDAAERVQARLAALRLTGVLVATNQGVASLCGTVQSWAEHDLAGLTALHTPGIYRVINNLAVIYRGYPWRAVSPVRFC